MVKLVDQLQKNKIGRKQFLVDEPKSLENFPCLINSSHPKKEKKVVDRVEARAIATLMDLFVSG